MGGKSRGLYYNVTQIKFHVLQCNTNAIQKSGQKYDFKNYVII